MKKLIGLGMVLFSLVAYGLWTEPPPQAQTVSVGSASTTSKYGTTQFCLDMVIGGGWSADSTFYVGGTSGNWQIYTTGDTCSFAFFLTVEQKWTTTHASGTILLNDHGGVAFPMVYKTCIGPAIDSVTITRSANTHAAGIIGVLD